MRSIVDKKTLRLVKILVMGILLGWMGMSDAYAQPTEEELLNALKVTPTEDHDSIYYELFKVNRVSDVSKATLYAKNSFHLSEKYNNSFRIARAYRAMAYLYSGLNERDSSRIYYLKGIKFSKEHGFNELQMYMLNGLGNLFERQDFYDSALRYYNMSLEVAFSLKLEGDKAIAMNNIGLVFYNLRNFDEALKNLMDALRIKKANKISDGLPLNLMNIAVIYNDQGKYDEAIDFLEQVKKECAEGCLDVIKADYFYGLGYSYFGKGDLKKSLQYFIECYELARAIDNKKTTANTLYYFSHFKLLKQDYLGALNDLIESEKLAEEINLRRLKRDIYQTYITIYKATGNLNKIIEFQEKYMAIKDDIFNEQLASQIMNNQLDAQKKQSDLIIQQKETQLSRSRWIIAFVTVVALLLVVIAFLLFNRYRLNRRLKQILQRQVQLRTGDLIQNNEELRQLNLEFEKLLSQTSRYIHGPMTTLIGLINLAEKDQSDPERTQKYLAKIKRVAGEMGLSLEQLKQVGKVKEQKQVEDSTLTLEELLKNDV